MKTETLNSFLYNGSNICYSFQSFVSNNTAQAADSA